jgi:RNA polymerase sigma factor FliA
MAIAALPMVRRIVRDISSRVPRSVDRDELLSAGMLGLAQAQRSYRAETGVPFEVHARSRVTGAILDDLRSRDWLTRPQRARARLVLAADNSAAGRCDEIAARISLRPAEVRQTLTDLDRAARLQQSVSVSETSGAYDVAGDGPDPLTHVLDQELIAHMREAVNVLPPRLRRVIEAVYFEERQMQALAIEMGVTPSRVSQLCAEALGRLKSVIVGFDRHPGGIGR